MAEIILKEVGPDKIKVIKVFREVTGWGLKEAKEAVDAVEQGTPARINVEADTVSSVMAQFNEAGAVVTSQNGRFGERTSFGERKPVQEATASQESASSTVKLDTAIPQGREETLNMLYEAGRIAESSEALDKEASSIRTEINAQKKKADELRKVVSGKAKAIKWIVILCSLITWPFLAVIGGVIITIIVWVVMNKTVIKSDLKAHEAENNANAEKYITEHVAPLENSLQEVEKQIAELETSGKIAWAKDIVGEDMFYSACIGDLYDLVKSRRADNLKEALNLYDDVQYKARMEESQAAIQNASEVAAAEAVKQTAYSKEIEKNTHQAATAAKATAHHTRQTAYNTKQVDKNTRRFR